MHSSYWRCFALAAVVCRLAAQTFEVASVKPAVPQPPERRAFTMLRGGPGTQDPDRITYTNATLMQLITRAWDLRSFQIFGPAWIENERYDITAKIPAGTNKEQFGVMLQ